MRNSDLERRARWVRRIAFSTDLDTPSAEEMARRVLGAAPLIRGDNTEPRLTAHEIVVNCELRGAARNEAIACGLALWSARYRGATISQAEAWVLGAVILAPRPALLIEAERLDVEGIAQHFGLTKATVRARLAAIRVEAKPATRQLSRTSLEHAETIRVKPFRLHA